MFVERSVEKTCGVEVKFERMGGEPVLAVLVKKTGMAVSLV